MLRIYTTLAVLLFAGSFNLEGSGTYNPPSTSSPNAFFSIEDIQQGQRLYQAQNASTNKPTCASCHNRGKSHVLRRSQLKRSAENLRFLIKNCLTDPSRADIQTPSDSSVVRLGIYLIARYRLPHNAFQYLNIKKTKPEMSQ